MSKLFFFWTGTVCSFCMHEWCTNKLKDFMFSSPACVHANQCKLVFVRVFNFINVASIWGNGAQQLHAWRVVQYLLIKMCENRRVLEFSCSIFIFTQNLCMHRVTLVEVKWHMQLILFNTLENKPGL